MNTDAFWNAFDQMLLVYAIVIVLSMAVAGLIHALVSLLARGSADSPKAAAPVAASAAPRQDAPAPAAARGAGAVAGAGMAADAIPAAHWVLISAAVAAVMDRPHRIVHIETPGRATGWTAEARNVHRSSHAPRHNP